MSSVELKEVSAEEQPAEEKVAEKPRRVLIKPHPNDTQNRPVLSSWVARHAMYQRIQPFYTPQLPPYKFSDRQSITPIEILRSHRLLLLLPQSDSEGQPVLTRNENNQFARKIAFEFKEKFAEKHVVSEWRRNYENWDLNVLLEMQKANGVFLLTDFTPREILYNLTMLFDVAERKDHYIILTLNQFYRFWTRERYRDYLFRPGREILDEENMLLVNFIDLLYQNEKVLRPAVTPSFRRQYQDAVDDNDRWMRLEAEELALGWSLGSILEHLQDLDNMQAFVDSLIDSLKYDLNWEELAAKVEEILGQIAYRGPRYAHWLQHFSDERRASILLTSALLSGLYEDQFFSAAEGLIQIDWRNLRPGFKTFDYGEFRELSTATVDFLETGEERRIIEMRDSHRWLVITECWRSFERLIVSSLEGLQVLIENSAHDAEDGAVAAVNGQLRADQLYGTEYKPHLLRIVLAEAFAQLGVHSPEWIEKILFRLGCSEEVRDQELAAYALFDWHYLQQIPAPEPLIDEEGGGLLKRWLEQPARVFDRSISPLVPGYQELIDNSKANRIATCAITLGFVFTVETPNDCSKPVCDMYRAVLGTPEDLTAVHDMLGKWTVPLMMKFHLQQFHESLLIYQTMKYPVPAAAVAYGLSLAYMREPEQFNTIMLDLKRCSNRLHMENQWWLKWILYIFPRFKLNKRMKEKEMGYFPPFERLMFVRIAVYGNLKYTEGLGRIDADRGYFILYKIYRKMRFHPRLRYAVADAVQQQASQYFKDLKDHISTIVNHLSFRHAMVVLPGLVSTARKDRLKREEEIDKIYKKIDFADPEVRRKFKEKDYDEERIVTDTEEEMFDWMRNGKRKSVALALRTLFCLRQTNPKNDKEYASFNDEMKARRFWYGLQMLFIWPFAIPFGIHLFLGSYVTLANLYRVYPKETRAMLDIWVTKLKWPYVGVGWRLYYFTMLRYGFTIVLIIYIFVLTLNWEALFRLYLLLF